MKIVQRRQPIRHRGEEKRKQGGESPETTRKSASRVYSPDPPGNAHDRHLRRRGTNHGSFPAVVARAASRQGLRPNRHRGTARAGAPARSGNRLPCAARGDRGQPLWSSMPRAPPDARAPGKALDATRMLCGRGLDGFDRESLHAVDGIADDPPVPVDSAKNLMRVGTGDHAANGGKTSGAQ